MAFQARRGAPPVAALAASLPEAQKSALTRGPQHGRQASSSCQPTTMLLHRGLPTGFPAVAPVRRPASALLGSPADAKARRRFSFIKQVMDQVKRDMEKDESLKKAFEDLEKSGARERSEKLREQASKQEERLREFSQKLKETASNTGSFFSEMKKKASEAKSDASEAASQKVEQMSTEDERVKAAKETFRNAAEKTNDVRKVIAEKGAGIFNVTMDKASEVFSFLGSDAGSRKETNREWKANRDTVRAATAEQDAKQAEREKMETAAREDPESEAAARLKEAQQRPDPADAGALVVSNTGSSSWDRFRLGTERMPFLSNFFDNPLVDQIMGETEIAASIREMKEMDPNFRLADFAEEVETVIAPHLVRSYLEGDLEKLDLHCGDAAYQAVAASIKERKRQKLYLDTSILAGPSEVELKGAKLMDGGSPSFIWTFNTQQINCLEDSKGEIVEGAVDDIRQVYYAMVIRKHPDAGDMGIELEYPWEVQELAIVGNQSLWG